MIIKRTCTHTILIKRVKQTSLTILTFSKHSICYRTHCYSLNPLRFSCTLYALLFFLLFSSSICLLTNPCVYLCVSVCATEYNYNVYNDNSTRWDPRPHIRTHERDFYTRIAICFLVSSIVSIQICLVFCLV